MPCAGRATTNTTLATSFGRICSRWLRSARTQPRTRYAVKSGESDDYQRKPTPARGTFRARLDGSRLTIDSGELKTYEVEILKSDPSIASKAIRLRGANGALVDVAVYPWGTECDCGSYIYRSHSTGEPCRHIRALRGVGLIR